jgi:hypothetical protein
MLTKAILHFHLQVVEVDPGDYCIVAPDTVIFCEVRKILPVDTEILAYVLFEHARFHSANY